MELSTDKVRTVINRFIGVKMRPGPAWAGFSKIPICFRFRFLYTDSDSTNYVFILNGLGI